MCWIKFDCFCYKYISGGFTFTSNLIFCFLGFLWFPCTLTQTKEVRRDAERPKGVSRVRQQFVSFDFLRWPKSVTAISICSRQFQFHSRQFQFLPTAISIYGNFKFSSNKPQVHCTLFQEPITRSEQLPCVVVTHFPSFSIAFFSLPVENRFLLFELSFAFPLISKDSDNKRG